jgi:hypothetical protein
MTKESCATLRSAETREPIGSAAIVERTLDRLERRSPAEACAARVSS